MPVDLWQWRIRDKIRMKQPEMSQVELQVNSHFI